MTVLRVLGEIAVEVDGRPVDLGTTRQRCLLAALAVDAGRVVPVDRLVERIWGPDLPRRGRATLYSYVSRLRQALAEVDGLDIVRRSGGYVLTTGDDGPVLDLPLFRTLCARARTEPDPAAAPGLLSRALDLWQGEALTGLDCAWADAERRQLGEERLAAQRALVDARLRAGEGDALVAELATRVVDHPLDEHVAGQYMRALHQAGRGADALEHYHRIRTRLVEELGTDPGTALQDLQQTLLSTTRTAGGPPAVCHQLPRAPRPFVGRDDDLARLDAVLDPREPGGTVVISAIAGAGGIGKTWLALHWAHRHTDRFPDGQLYVDLRGFSPDHAPMAPAAAIRGFLDALGVEPRQVPIDPHAGAALFRNLVTGRRMLLVLDNAADTTQVTPLLPGGDTCTVLVTGRTQLTGLVTGHAAHHLRLDVLTEDEARLLLTSRLGAARTTAESAAADRLIAFCGGFPLALGIVAARAQLRPDLPLSVLAGELRDAGLQALADDDPTASLPTVLSWSLDALAPEQASAFALLGVAPGPDLGPEAAAALLDRPPADTQRILRGLEQASLLTRTGRGRYRLHDLIRRHATLTAAGLPAHVRAAAQHRVVDFYLHTAYRADRLLNPHREPGHPAPAAPRHAVPGLPDDAAALSWFDTEHACLLAALDTASGNRRHRTTWDLAWALETFHRRQGHLHDRLGTWQVAMTAAGHLADPATRILTHRLLGRAHADLGAHTQANVHLQEALTLAERHDDTTNQAHTHRTLAAAWGAQGDHHKAREHARQALRISRDVGNPDWEAGALNAIGWYAAQLGGYDEAREHCEAALDLFRRQGNAEGEATTSDSLGYIAHRVGNHAEAVGHYREAIGRLREIGSTNEEAGTLDRLGTAYAALGRHSEAAETWRDALTLCRRQGRDDDARRVQRQLDALERIPVR
ncbi:tetratricopeptide repeat protein [Amycolatopsis sp. NBC_01307]|uniref:AfsR/SARP family transcriptional regulator n=1 Tax=Amycolatopsis sp. NBC_01307 TaxID=2903561 RepID=UPI002E13718F|nr:tetratricopeptide repeat protein [Amycolatopsis sp. NBC_01307]